MPQPELEIQLQPKPEPLTLTAVFCWAKEGCLIFAILFLAKTPMSSLKLGISI